MSEASHTLFLDPPISAKGGVIDRIELTEPRARHVRDAEKKLDARMSEASISEYEMALVASCSGVDPAVVEKLTVRQLAEAAAFLQDFIGDAFEDIDEDPLDDLPDGDFEVTVDPPLTWNKISYPVLTLREPTADEMKRARNMTRQTISIYTCRCRDMELLRLVTGLPPAVIDGLRISTLTEATRKLARFLAAGRRIGKRSASN